MLANPASDWDGALTQAPQAYQSYQWWLLYVLTAELVKSLYWALVLFPPVEF